MHLVGTNDGVANRYVEPTRGALGGKYLLFHRGEHVTLQGKGYFLVRWELAFFNRGGVITPSVSPDFNVTTGMVKKVALAGRYEPDLDLDGTPGVSSVWHPGYQTGTTEYIPTSTVPSNAPGMPSLWIDEYYYLDGTMTVTNREQNVDYNISLTPKTWSDVASDLHGTKPLAGKQVLRSGISLDPYNGATTPASPVDLVASAVSGSTHLSWHDCANSASGYIVEYSYGGTFGGKHYPSGALYTTADSLPAAAQSVVLGKLAPGTQYFVRVKAYNNAGDSAYSNVVQLTTPLTAPVAGAWHRQDIGTVAVPGSASVANGTFRVQAGTGDISRAADSFEFTYQTLTGNGSITARVVDQTYTASTAKAGVMMRATLDSNAPDQTAALSVNGTEYSLHRNVSGAITATEPLVGAVGQGTAPYWLRVTRMGNLFTSSGSSDGKSWTVLSQHTITMPNQIFVGLAYASVTNSVGAGVFDNVTIGNG